MRDVLARAPHDQLHDLRVRQRVRPRAKEEREERRKLGATVVHRRRSDEQHLRARCQRCEYRIAQRRGRSRMMCFVEHDQVEGPAGNVAARQRAVRHHCCAHPRDSKRVAPHHAQAGGENEQRPRRLAHQRRRDVRFAEPRLVGEKRAAMLVQESSKAIDRTLLMCIQRDRSERRSGLFDWKPVRRHEAARDCRPHDHRADHPIRGATSTARRR